MTAEEQGSIEPAGDSPTPPAIRRGKGMRLSTQGPPAEERTPEPPAVPPAAPKLRGQGLRLSTHAAPPDGAAATPPPSMDQALELALAAPSRVRLAHGEVSYRQSGGGPPLLLIHGWAASSRYWFGALAQLADIRSCYAIDLPGFGGSQSLPEPAAIARQAALVIEFADALGLEQFDLNGHSFGGSVAAYLAAHWPSRVRRLVLTSIGVRRSALERALLGLVLRPVDLALQIWQPWLNMARPLSGLLQPMAASLMSVPPLPRLMSSWYLEQAPADERWLREGILDLTRMDFAAHLACVASIGDSSLIAALAAIRAPTLLVSGRADRVVPQDDVAAAAEMVADSRLLILEQCGHVPLVEQPAAYHRALREFLLEV